LKRLKNVYPDGTKVRSGDRVLIRHEYGLPDEESTLRYDARLGWVFWSRTQFYIMPTRYNPYTRIQVFHLCEKIEGG